MENINIRKEKEFKLILEEFDRSEFNNHETRHGSIRLSEGCQYIKLKLNGSWIFDIIVKAQQDELVKKHKVQNWYVEQLKNKRTWAIFGTDGNKRLIYSETLPFAIFPLRSCQLWVIGKVAMLLPLEECS